MCICLHLCGCMFHVCRCPRKPKEGIGSSGARVTGTHEPDVDVENLNWGIWWRKMLIFIYTYIYV